MPLFFFLLIFYCIPISFVILGIRWVLRKEGKNRKAQNFTKYAFFGLFLCLIGFLTADYISRRYVFEFNLKNRYAIEIIAIQQAGFLDNPVDFYMEIEDLNSEQEVEFEFFTGGTSALQFYLEPEATEIIYINGIDSKIGPSVVIDMSNSSIKNRNILEVNFLEDLLFCAKISSSFELTIQ
jgi:hypothetical protein